MYKLVVVWQSTTICLQNVKFRNNGNKKFAFYKGQFCSYKKVYYTISDIPLKGNATVQNCPLRRLNRSEKSQFFRICNCGQSTNFQFHIGEESFTQLSSKCSRLGQDKFNKEENDRLLGIEIKKSDFQPEWSKFFNHKIRIFSYFFSDVYKIYTIQK